MKVLCGLILCLLILIQPLMADNKTDAEHLLKNGFDTAINILQNKEIEKYKKIGKINKVISSIFDFKKMAQLSL